MLRGPAAIDVIVAQGAKILGHRFPLNDACSIRRGMPSTQRQRRRIARLAVTGPVGTAHEQHSASQYQPHSNRRRPNEADAATPRRAAATSP